MSGIIKCKKVNEKLYHKHQEDKYLGKNSDDGSKNSLSYF